MERKRLIGWLRTYAESGDGVPAHRDIMRHAAEILSSERVDIVQVLPLAPQPETVTTTTNSQPGETRAPVTAGKVPPPGFHIDKLQPTPSESPLGWIVFVHADPQGYDYRIFTDEHEADAVAGEDERNGEAIPLYRASAFAHSAMTQHPDTARLDWLETLPCGITINGDIAMPPRLRTQQQPGYLRAFIDECRAERDALHPYVIDEGKPHG